MIQWGVKSVVSFASILYVSWLPITIFAAEDVGQIWRNNEAVGLQGQEKMIESFEAFAKLLGESPFDPVFQFNMGTGFLTTEDVDKARQLFEQLDQNPDLPPELQFYVAYNLGVIHGSTGQVDPALEAYQKALDFQPDSQEIKTNIELLIQKKKGGGGKGKKKNKDKKGKKGQKPDKNDEGKPDKGDEEEDQEQEPQEMQNQNPGYKGKDMSAGDVKKILEELKNQEQKIRAKHDRKGKREKDREKNW